MNIRKMIAAIMSVMVMTTAYAGPVQAAEDEAVSGAVSEFIRETKCDGISIAIYDQGNITFYGDEDALYQIGSMTKAFTGLAVRKLISEGLIDENAVVSTYIPGFSVCYDSAPADITIRNLLEMKSGFTNDELKYPSAESGMSLSEWALGLSGAELSTYPGSEYAYSNANYNLLGLIIENVTGMTYKEYMEKEILEPLGLYNTYVGTPNDGRIIEGTRLIYRHACVYHVDVREACIPAGYFYSNASDMARWLEIWTENADISEEIQDMVNDIRSALTGEGGYIYGWELFENDIIGHSGGTANYSSRIVFSQESGTGVCVLTNLNVAASTDSLCNNILDIINGGNAGKLSADVWTIFDRIFTVFTIACLMILFIMIFVGKRSILLLTCISLSALAALMLILFPAIFGAGLSSILLTWAPLSLTGGLISAFACIVFTAFKLISGITHADNNKTGRRQTLDRDN
ncbi:MAG: beta-lactamase family protein [Lachnospiraceae bacterium]|nr:beta-lactamase family protein [Lachnospiraceae bacterium]